MLPRIFELFVQADPAGPRSHGALGIGLTLASNLVFEIEHQLRAARAPAPGPHIK
jgi:signal transduction histidine kinase